MSKLRNATSATTQVSFRNTRVFRTALMALTEPCTLWRRISCFPSLRWWLALHRISKMYFSHWMPPGVSESMWSVNLDESNSGEYQTLGGHSCPAFRATGSADDKPGSTLCAGDKPGSTGDMSGSTTNHSRAVWEKQHLLLEHCWCTWKS